MSPSCLSQIFLGPFLNTLSHMARKKNLQNNLKRQICGKLKVTFDISESKVLGKSWNEAGI